MSDLTSRGAINTDFEGSYDVENIPRVQDLDQNRTGGRPKKKQKGARVYVKSRFY